MRNQPSVTVSIRTAALIALICFVLIAFGPYLTTHLNNVDNINSELQSWQETWSMGVDNARTTGRIQSPVFSVLTFIPYMSEHIVFRKAMQFVPMLAAGLGFAFLVARLTSVWTWGYLITAVWLGTLQNTWSHGLVTGFPFSFNFPFTLFLLSLFLFSQHVQRPSTWRLLVSSLLFYAVLHVYEMFVLFFVFVPLVAIVLSDTPRTPLQALRNALLQARFHTIAVLIYLATYFGYRWMHPSSYPGNQAHLVLSEIVRTLSRFLYGVLPLVSWETHLDMILEYADHGSRRSLLDTLSHNWKSDWLVAGILVGCATYAFLRATPRLTTRVIATSLGSALLCWILPVCLLSISPQYQQWTRAGVVTHSPSFFSTLGMAFTLVVLVTLFTQVVSLIGNRAHVVTSLVWSTLAMFTTVSTQMTNFYVARAQQASARRWALADQFIRNAQTDLPPKANTVAPQLWNNVNIEVNTADYWTRHAKRRGAGDLHISKTLDEAKAVCGSGPCPIYLARFGQRGSTPEGFGAYGLDAVDLHAKPEEVGQTTRLKVLLQTADRKLTLYLWSHSQTNGHAMVDGQVYDWPAEDEVLPIPLDVSRFADKPVEFIVTVEGKKIWVGETTISDYFEQRHQHAKAGNP